MELPDGLKRVFGVETAQHAPPEPKLPPQMAEWASTNRRDEVRTLYDEDAANYYADGLSDAQRAGIQAEVALLNLKEQRR